MSRTALFIIIILLCTEISAQTSNTVINGFVKDSSNKPLSLVNIAVKNMPVGTYTGDDGYFSITLPADNENQTLIFSRLGYLNYEFSFTAVADTIKVDIILEADITRLDDVVVTDIREREAPSLRNIPVKDISLMPAATGAVEKMLVSLPGINSNNELSNQYNVRGGSFDENLVYINDIEIYHPVLIKSGQQEGLSFINTDMVQNIRFSAGAYNASFGDRMSSVLDIDYKIPSKNTAGIKTGLLLNSAHIEGTGKNGRFSFIGGARLKTTRLLLQTLDTRANYKPWFYDIQTVLRYSINNRLKLSLLGSYNSNNYFFTPVSRRSSFGNFSEAYQLYVLYEGSETDTYDSGNIAFTIHHNTGNGLDNKLIAHYYGSREQETYDIRSSYSLNLLDKNLGSENFGDSIMNVGIGSWLNHARNTLKFSNYNISYKGRWEHGSNILSWGMKYNMEYTDDMIREWKKIDSAGYSIPYSDANLLLSDVRRIDTIISSNRIESYLIDSYTFSIDDHRFILTAGARFTHWSFSDELLFSPRASISWRPPSNTVSCYLAGGIYYQTPYYKEMRYPTGEINPNIRSQKSVHTVLGTEYRFSIGSTPLRLRTEIYYKDLENIIPYKYDNVRIVYSAENSARGYVRGIDLRLNGEFVKNAESWISVSIMDARHDILNDEYGFYPAPSDARFSINVFFQDYFPTNPDYRAHINLHYTTGVPVSSPYTDSYESYVRMPPYRRVDIGFTRVIINKYSLTSSRFASFFEEIIAGIEVFNLLDIRNTISYNWLSTVNNLNGETRQFAVPNYLTGRSLNIRLMMRF